MTVLRPRLNSDAKLTTIVASDSLSIRKAIDAYIRLIETPDLAADSRLEELPATLDRLAAAVHEAKYPLDEVDYPDAPSLDYKPVRSLAARHFPELGYYNVVHPVTQRVADASNLVGDGIDDITDILLDLKAIVWRWEHTSVDDALWNFTTSYRQHWGMHMRSLQYYLHVLLSGLEENRG